VTRLLAIAAFLFATAGTAAADTKTITLEEAIKLATEDSIQIDLGKEKILSAQAHKRATKTLRLPQVGIKASVILWNEKLQFPQEVTDPVTGEKRIVMVTVREQVTGGGEINVVQPITAASILGRLIEGDQAGIDAARAELDVARLDAAYQAAEAYLGALQTQTLHEVAESSLSQIEADLVKVRALRDAKVLADVDVFRLEAARDQAKQSALEAEVGGETARAGLALLLDLPEDTDLTLAPVDTTPPELGWTKDEAIAAARKQRPEVRAASRHTEQAEVGVDVVKAQYLPSVNAIGNYTRSEGQGVFGSKNSAFVGVMLEWNLWDWGKRGDDIDQAKSAVRSAKRYEEALDDQLAFDVKSKWLAASAKRKTVEVAESGLKASEEAYRLQKVKIEAGAATTTDVIDAESEVARARAQATIARYQYLISWMALVRAVGQVPDMSGAK
jgi:outer membrane protein TolC